METLGRERMREAARMFGHAPSSGEWLAIMLAAAAFNAAAWLAVVFLIGAIRSQLS